MIVSSGGAGGGGGGPGLGTTHLMSALQGKRPRLVAALNGTTPPPPQPPVQQVTQAQLGQPQAQPGQPQGQPAVVQQTPDSVEQRAAQELEDSKTRLHGEDRRPGREREWSDGGGRGIESRR